MKEDDLAQAATGAIKKLSQGLPSKRREGHRASILVRLTAWSSGARRRETDQTKLRACFGDAFELIAARSASAEQLSGRSRWPVNETAWVTLKPFSFWGATGAGLTINQLITEMGAPSLLPRPCPR